jgi:hypothetical protein
LNEAMLVKVSEVHQPKALAVETRAVGDRPVDYWRKP